MTSKAREGTKMSQTHVMLDLETYGVRPGCAIRSIGAVAFDRTAVFGTFYRNVRLKSCEGFGLRVEPETAKWWDEQSAEARNVLEHDQRHLGEALADFMSWCGLVTMDLLWAHGASFDIPIIAAAAHAAYVTTGDERLKPAWSYRDFRDTRTLYELAGVRLSDIPYIGTRHYALDDALHQTMGVMRAWAVLGLGADVAG